MANDFPAIMQVGKSGITDQLLKTVSDALEARELIKLHILENSGEEPKVAANQMAEALGAEVVSVVGRKAVLYRASSKKPVIELP